MTQIQFGLGINHQNLNLLNALRNDFDSVWVADHFMPKKKFRKYFGDSSILEGFTTISYLSGVFQNLFFGNMVLCNSFRNPALLAKMGATLQTLTGGRFILGIGAGCEEDEYVAYGYEFPSSRVRIEQLEEGVQIIKQMWSAGVATFKGKYYQVDEAYCQPKPNPVPPILIGSGKGENLILKVVARYADWWNLGLTVSPKNFQRKLELLKEHCRKEGRDHEEIVKTLQNAVAIAKTEDNAWKIASALPFIRGHEENYVIGTPDMVTEKIFEYVKLGVSHFILNFIDFGRQKIDGAKLFARKVIPTFAT